MPQLDRLFKSLGNRRRLAIVKLLKQKQEASVTEIAEHIKLSHRSTSKHLAVLSAADVVDKEQRSLSVFYRLNLNNSDFNKILTLV